MKDKAIVCNIGHFDNEIDMAWLNKNYGHTSQKSNHKWIYTPWKRKTNHCFGGREIGEFGLCYGHPSFVMSNSFTNQTLAQIELVEPFRSIRKQGLYVAQAFG